MLTLVIDRYGTEAMTWHPTTLKMQIEQDYNVQLPKLTFDRLLAAITLVTTDYFFQSLTRFIDLCNVLAGDDFDPGTFNPADASECAWGITECLLLNPPEEEDPFTDEIRQYIAATLANEGFVKPPDVLRIALNADHAQKVQYDFEDDPEMFQAIFEVQASKADEVTAMLQENIADLIAQIHSLPLDNGSTTELIKRIPQNLRPRAAAQPLI